jgi:hypothetical protein
VFTHNIVSRSREKRNSVFAFPQGINLPEQPLASRVGRLFTLFEAKAAGLKSASAWKKEGREITPDVRPSGFVVTKVGVSQGVSNLEYAVLESLGNNRYQVVMDGWDVYSMAQTQPSSSKRRKSPTFEPQPTSQTSLPEETPQESSKKAAPSPGEEATGGHPPYVIHPNNMELDERDGEEEKLGTGVWLSIPNNLTIPDTHKDVTEEIYYYLHTVLVGRFNSKHDPDGTVRIHRKTMQQILGNPARETKARTFLLDRGILYSDHIYRQGDFSKSYGLNPQYFQEVTRYQVTKPKLANKIKLARLKRLDIRKEREVQRSTLVDYLDAWAKRIDIDLNGCQREAGTLPHPTFHLIPAVAIANRDYRLQRDDYGRVHSPFTQLWTPLRGYLRFQDEPLHNIDTRNSQIVFMSKLMREEHLARNRAESADVQKFIGLVEEGRIYDHLLELAQQEIGDYLKWRKVRAKQKAIWHERFLLHVCTTARPRTAAEWNAARRAFQRRNPIKAIEVPVTEVARSDFKQMLFADVFYGKREVSTRITGVFRHEFASVHQFILDQKASDYRQLACNMQRAEAELMIDTVCLRLMMHHTEIPLVTIHDSIMTTEEHIPTVARIMVDDFERLGFRPQFKVNDEEYQRPAIS